MRRAVWTGLRVVHPFLFAVSPILMLYAARPGMIFPEESVRSLLTALLVTGTLFSGLSWLATPGKAAMVTGMAVIATLAFYSSLTTAADLVSSVGSPNWGSEHFLAWFLILWLSWPIVGAVLILRSKAEWIEINTILTIVGAFLVCSSLVRIVSAEARMSDAGDVYPRDASLRSAGTVNAGRDPAPGDPDRDIYYIILDRYANNHTLMDVYGFDNDVFLRSLEDRGFYVARESHANYLKTAQSLSSSLNLEHVDYLEQRYGGDSWNHRPLRRRLRDHQVLRYLHARDYAFLQLGSWWEPTRTNPRADETYTSYPVSEFAMVVLRSTFLPTLADMLDVRMFNSIRYHCDGLSRQFDSLMGVVDREGPKFVFAHLLLPHPPFVRDSDGRCLSFEEAASQTARDGYISQLVYANTLIEEFLHRLDLGGADDPIVIIQSDEGPFPGAVESREDWQAASPGEIRQKMGILNAYYLPGVESADVLYPSITPVNTFRVLFNEYFGERYEMLEDSAYAHESEQRPYSFFDVTGIVSFDGDEER